MNAARAWFRRVVLAKPWLAFIVMVLSFFAFGIGTLNLFHLLSANGRFLLTYGWEAIVDGGLRQLVELLANSFLAMMAYVVFKACEHRLSHWLSDD